MTVVLLAMSQLDIRRSAIDEVAVTGILDVDQPVELAAPGMLPCS